MCVVRRSKRRSIRPILASKRCDCGGCGRLIGRKTRLNSTRATVYPLFRLSRCPRRYRYLNHLTADAPTESKAAAMGAASPAPSPFRTGDYHSNKGALYADFFPKYLTFPAGATGLTTLSPRADQRQPYRRNAQLLNDFGVSHSRFSCFMPARAYTGCFRQAARLLRGFGG